MTITIEVTAETLQQLAEGAAQFGRCAVLVNTTDGAPVYLAATGNHKKRSHKARAAEAAPDLPLK